MIVQIIRLIRVKHWIKNLFIFAPLIFAVRFLDPPSILLSALTFFAFCFGASFIYVVNDIADRDKDRLHPEKINRPIASGKLKPPTAILIAAICLIASLGLAFLVNIPTLAVLGGYILLNLVYSFLLKHQVILDVFIISIGFVLRIVAGAVSIDVVMSNWLFLTTMFISLFLGFGKRRHELLVMEDSANHRPVLKDYNLQLLDYIIVISVTLTIITYSLYTIDSDTIDRLGTDKLVFTIPLVLYGIFRYMYNIYKKDKGGDPGEIVLQDIPILITLLIWAIGIIVLLYFKL